MKEERKKRRRRRREKGRKPNLSRAVVGPGQARNRTALLEVGVFLPRFYFMLRGLVMAYGFRSDFGRICMLCDLFVMGDSQGPSV